MNELIGMLGLPGAGLALMGMFLLGIKIKNEMRSSNGNGNGGPPKLGSDPHTYPQAVVLAHGLTERIDLAERSLNANVNQTRHDFGNKMEVLIDRFETALDRYIAQHNQSLENQTKTLVAELSRGRD